jgi:hypothetical protein
MRRFLLRVVLAISAVSLIVLDLLLSPRVVSDELHRISSSRPPRHAEYIYTRADTTIVR